MPEEERILSPNSYRLPWSASSSAVSVCPLLCNQTSKTSHLQGKGFVWAQGLQAEVQGTVLGSAQLW